MGWRGCGSVVVVDGRGCGLWMGVVVGCRLWIGVVVGCGSAWLGRGRGSAS